MHQVEHPAPLGLQESLTQFKHFEQVLKERLDIAVENVPTHHKLWHIEWVDTGEKTK